MTTFLRKWRDSCRWLERQQQYTLSRSNNRAQQESEENKTQIVCDFQKDFDFDWSKLLQKKMKKTTTAKFSFEGALHVSIPSKEWMPRHFLFLPRNDCGEEQRGDVLKRMICYQSEPSVETTNRLLLPPLLPTHISTSSHSLVDGQTVLSGVRTNSACTLRLIYPADEIHIMWTLTAMWMQRA